MEAASINKKTATLLVRHSVVAALIFAVIFFITYAYPVIYTSLLPEDGWLENSNSIFPLAAAFQVLALMMFVPGSRKIGTFLLFGFCFFVGGEEISWGERIFSLNAPYALTSRNLQGELTLHNLPIFQEIIFRIFFPAFFTGTVLLPVFSPKMPRVRSFCQSFGIPLMPAPLWPYFTLIFVVYLSRTLIVKRYEVIELILSGCLFVYTYIQLKKAKPRFHVFWPLGICLLVITLLTYSFPPTPNQISSRFNLNVLAYEKFGFDKQAEEIFIHMLQKPELIDRKTHYEYARFLLERGEKLKAEQVIREGIEYLDGEIKKDPSFSKLSLMKGKLYRLLEVKELALLSFKEALQKAQNEADANGKTDTSKAVYQMRIAEIYFAMNRPDSAKEVLTNLKSLKLPKKYRSKITALEGQLLIPSITASENLK